MSTDRPSSASPPLRLVTAKGGNARARRTSLIKPFVAKASQPNIDGALSADASTKPLQGLACAQMGSPRKVGRLRPASPDPVNRQRRQSRVSVLWSAGGGLAPQTDCPPIDPVDRHTLRLGNQRQNGAGTHPGFRPPVRQRSKSPKLESLKEGPSLKASICEHSVRRKASVVSRLLGMVRDEQNAIAKRNAFAHSAGNQASLPGAEIGLRESSENVVSERLENPQTGSSPGSRNVAKKCKKCKEFKHVRVEDLLSEALASPRFAASQAASQATSQVNHRVVGLEELLAEETDREIAQTVGSLSQCYDSGAASSSTAFRKARDLSSPTKQVSWVGDLIQLSPDLDAFEVSIRRSPAGELGSASQRLWAEEGNDSVRSSVAKTIDGETKSKKVEISENGRLQAEIAHLRAQIATGKAFRGWAAELASARRHMRVLAKCRGRWLNKAVGVTFRALVEIVADRRHNRRMLERASRKILNHRLNFAVNQWRWLFRDAQATKQCQTRWIKVLTVLTDLV